MIQLHYTVLLPVGVKEPLFTGSGKLQDTALDILTHIDGEDYHNNNGATTTTTTPIHECSCEDMMFILRGVSNNGTQVILYYLGL